MVDGIAEFTGDDAGDYSSGNDDGDGDSTDDDGDGDSATVIVTTITTIGPATAYHFRGHCRVRRAWHLGCGKQMKSACSLVGRHTKRNGTSSACDLAGGGAGAGAGGGGGSVALMATDTVS